jgi:WXXGXW repeat (2 copies)
MSIHTAVRSLAVAVMFLIAPIVSHAYFSIGVTVGFAPPALPVYEQPPCPGEGYLWTPGYWAYDEVEGYYWVPGSWVLPPRPGLLWTPGYWAWGPGGYAWNAGYWGPEVGFYGGIDYGFGYFGIGFSGGYWRGDDFVYNRAVVNVTNVNETNVYYNQITNNTTRSNVSYHGGPGGVQTQPTTGELAAAHEPHYGMTDTQLRQASVALSTPGLAARVNHGHPQVAAIAAVGHIAGTSARAGTSAMVAHGASTSMRSRVDMGDRNLSHTPTSLGNHASERPAGATVPGARRSFGSSPPTDRPRWASVPAARPGVTQPRESQPRSRFPAWQQASVPPPRLASTPPRAVTPAYANGSAWHRADARPPSGVHSSDRHPSWSEPHHVAAGTARPGTGRWAQGYAPPAQGRSMPSYQGMPKTPARSSAPRVAAGPSRAQKGEHYPPNRA